VDSVVQFFVFVPIAITSAVAWWVGRRVLGLAPPGLEPVWRTLECLGMTAIFLVLNVLAGMAVVLTARALTSRFFPLYAANDLMLLPLSLAQALVFWWWRAGSRRDER